GSGTPSTPYIDGLQQAVDAPLWQPGEIGGSSIALSDSGGGVVRWPTLSSGEAAGVEE
ncbi:hypothetical protein GGI00_006993, partial [Coemansia sp. RSA 2681]